MKIINVTANDIDKGERLDADSCPVARALSRKLRDYVVLVNISTVYLDDGDISMKYTLPSSVSDIIRYFDETGVMEPFRFRFYEEHCEVM